jgi:hypothetical protein
MKGARKRRGRPRIPKQERRSKNRTFRVRGNLDDYLIGQAHEAGRSVSEEIEARLERSFYTEWMMATYTGDAQPILNAIAFAVLLSFLEGSSGLDRYRVMQAATGYIIAAFGSQNTAKMHSRAQVLEVRWPPPNGRPEGYELKGMKIAYWVLKNLGTEMPEEQTAELAEILGTDAPTQLEIR